MTDEQALPEQKDAVQNADKANAQNGFRGQPFSKKRPPVKDGNRPAPRQGEEPQAAPLPPDVPVEIIGVNFKPAGKIYYFSPNKVTFQVGERVILETSRGVEIGTVKFANREVLGKEITPPLKSIMRRATEEDLKRDAENRELEMSAMEICRQKIREHKLEMSLVASEYTFDRAKLIFYFTCETRVDFRELVKNLASTFHTRIELRQIGIRDEAKLMGGLGVCGRPYCCTGFLADFVQVSIKMAKEQNFSLNSAKVSGACGRLMCCLRYEHEVYEEAIRVTPPVGSTVQTADGVGVVVETRPLAEQVRVKLTEKEKEDIRLYPCAKITLVGAAAKTDDGENEKEEKAETKPERPRNPGQGGGKRFDRRPRKDGQKDGKGGNFSQNPS